jgi:signal transduction histidine kinase
MRKNIAAGKVWKGRIANTRKDGTLYQAETTISPVRDATGSIRNFVIVSYDVTKEATLESQLIQAQKMEAIGELASGIAHEINTPTQYIGDNIRFFQESYGNICALLDRYESLVQALRRKDPPKDHLAAIERMIKEIDLEYLKEEVPTAIQQSLEGNSRVAEIVRAMKEFAHPGLEEKVGFDINHAIQNTIAVARNEWKYVADVQLDLDPNLPEVPCLPGSFNQVVLNIVVNAAHAIADVVDGGAKGKGTIAISTRVADGWAEIRIADTGTGIPESIRKKIFDPFFTTKRAGKGTGQGLALVHSVIVEKHSGTVDVESEVSKGSTFIIRLPMADTQLPAEELELAGSPGIG